MLPSNDNREHIGCNHCGRGAGNHTPNCITGYIEKIAELYDKRDKLEAELAELREWFLSEYGGKLPLRIMEILKLDQDALPERTAQEGSDGD